MVTCGNCGSTVSEDVGTCPECGADLAGGAASDREISSEEAESGTTRIYGVSGTGEGGEPPSEPGEGESGEGETGEGEPAAVDGSTTTVSKTDDSPAVGPEASDPPPGSRPTRESPEESDGGSRRRILAGLGVLALGAGGVYAVLGRDGGDDSGDGQDSADGDGTDGDSTDDASGDGTGTDDASETDGSEPEDSTSVDDGSSGDGLEIEMGILMAETGGLEELGPPIRDGAELVARQVNQADGQVAVDTRFEDTGTDATQGIGGAEALVDAGYPMICGALASEVSLAVAESVAVPTQVPMNSPSSTAPAYTNLEGDFTFRTAVPDSFQGKVMADIGRNRMGADTAATLVQDDAYGRQLSTAFIESFAAAGGTVTDEVIFERGLSSYDSQLATALYGDPDLLVVVAFPPDGVQIFQDYYARFYRGDMSILVSDALRDENIPDHVDYEMTNVTGTYPLQEGPGLDFFRELYQETYGVDPTEEIFVQHAYDAAATLVLAQAAAGESDGTAIRDQIRPVTEPGGTEIRPANLVEGVELAATGEEIEYRGASGEIQYDDQGDQTAVAYEYFGFDAYGGIERLDRIELG